MTRVLAIGIDAAEWTHVESLLDAGLLPNLSRLYEAGSWHPMVAEPGYRQSFALNQFLAGRSIGPGDRWEMCEFDSSTYSTHLKQSDQHVDCPAFYERIPGLQTIVFDVPWANFGQAPNVIGLVGWGAESPHHPRASHPADLLRAIEDRVGPHPLTNFDRWGWHHPSRIDALVESAAVGAQRRVAALSILQEQLPHWELALVVMSETHAAGEFLWHGVDQTHPLAKVVDADHAAARLAQVYVDVDDAIGRMVDGCPADTTVVIFSLYGARCGGGDVPSVVLLPELLHRLSGADRVLRSADPAVWKAAGCPPLVPRRSDTWSDAMEALWMGPAERSAVDRIRRGLKHVIPTRWHPRVRQAAHQFGRGAGSRFGRPVFEDASASHDGDHQHRGPNLDWNFCSRYRPWWPSMRAFAVHSFSEGMIRVNLAGREAGGIVPLHDYETACDEVEEALYACTNPRTGRGAVRKVIRAHPADPVDPNGPYADLIVVWDGPTDALEHPVAGLIGPVPFNRPGAHTSNAFAIVCPTPSHIDNAPTERHAAVTRDTALGAGHIASAIDLPPTILSLLGRGLPEGVEGSPLT